MTGPNTARGYVEATASALGVSMAKVDEAYPQCYMCGHFHQIMASWSSQGETRRLCHGVCENDCYTQHNHAQGFRRVPEGDPYPALHRRGSALDDPNSENLGDRIDQRLKDMRDRMVNPTAEIEAGLNQVGMYAQQTSVTMNSMAVWLRSMRYLGGPDGELKMRLNKTFRGEDPGEPVNWLGLEGYIEQEKQRSGTPWVKKPR